MRLWLTNESLGQRGGEAAILGPDAGCLVLFLLFVFVAFSAVTKSFVTRGLSKHGWATMACDLNFKQFSRKGRGWKIVPVRLVVSTAKCKWE